MPVKTFEGAKQRLASVLSPAERSTLSETMLEDVLEALARWKDCPPVVVVTGEPRALRLAQKFSFEVMDDPANAGESEAIAMASVVCNSRAVSGTLVLPGDIPLLKASELASIFAAAPQQGTVLVPSFNGSGTNAALRRPADLFPLRFGEPSFERHIRAACATRGLCVTLQLPSIALDVDTPADLALLLSAEGSTRAQQLLRSWNVTDRLTATVSG